MKVGRPQGSEGVPIALTTPAPEIRPEYGRQTVRGASYALVSHAPGCVRPV